VDILRTDESAWDTSGMVQLVWEAVVLFLPVHRLFFAIAHPTLTALTVSSRKARICQVAFSMVG